LSGTRGKTSNLGATVYGAHHPRTVVDFLVLILKGLN